MKYFHRVNLFLIMVSTLISCHKQKGDFRMEEREFLLQANQQLIYQRSLDEELLKIHANPTLSQFATRRQQSRTIYLQEIISKVDNWPKDANLSKQAIKDLESLRLSPATEHDKLLIRLIVVADQNFIGLHVKSSGPAGLKNADLRNWADQKLPALRDKLNESQYQLNKM
jgi:hypothetical protein